MLKVDPKMRYMVGETLKGTLVTKVFKNGQLVSKTVIPGCRNKISREGVKEQTCIFHNGEARIFNQTRTGEQKCFEVMTKGKNGEWDKSSIKRWWIF